MKAVFVVFNQAVTEQVMDTIEHLGLRGYTEWRDVTGRGSNEGEPHLGSHAWPAMNSAILIFTSEEEASALRQRLAYIDAERPQQGIRTFAWTIDD